MRMSSRDQNAIGPELGACGGQLFGFVEQDTRHHAAIDHHDRQPLHSIVHDKSTSIDAGRDLIGRVRNHAAIDQHWQLIWRDVHLGRPHSQFCAQR